MTVQNIYNWRELFDNIQESFEYYEDNIKNTLFEKDDEESFETACKRGESLYDQLDETIVNLTNVLQYENEIIEFFKKCKGNLKVYHQQKNEMINKILRYKKECSTMEDYLYYKEEMNSQRNETDYEKKRRECLEIVEIIQQEKKEIVELVKEMKKLKEDFRNDGFDMNFKWKEMKNSISSQIDMKMNDIVFNTNMLQFVHLKKSIPTLNKDHIAKLQEWTNKKFGEIIFDSDKNDWTTNKAFNDMINKKKHLLFIIEDIENNVFGGYIDVEIDITTIEGSGKYIEDSNAFIFSLESNGRLKKPMKFEVKNSKQAFYLNVTNDIQLFSFGNWDIRICSQNKRNESCFERFRGNYDLLTMKYAFTKEEPISQKKTNFTPKRFFVIEMI